jgi:hypothetical protein
MNAIDITLFHPLDLQLILFSLEKDSNRYAHIKRLTNQAVKYPRKFLIHPEINW